MWLNCLSMYISGDLNNNLLHFFWKLEIILGKECYIKKTIVLIYNQSLLQTQKLNLQYYL